MVPLYVLSTKIYQFVAKFFQIGQISNFQRIDGVSDHGARPVRLTWQTLDDAGKFPLRFTARPTCRARAGITGVDFRIRFHSTLSLPVSPPTRDLVGGDGGC
jgi:hypothetical protein